MGQPQIPVPTLETTRKPEKLYEFLRLFSDSVRKLDLSNDKPVMFELTPDMITTIRDMLQANGSDPLNVNGLLGVLAQPQVAAIVIASSLPNAASYMPGTLLVVTGTPDTFYYCKQGNPNTWQALSTTPTNMMTLDTVQTVVSSAVKTIQASWIFEVTQTIVSAPNSGLYLVVHNTNAVGNSATGAVRAQGSTALLDMLSYGSSNVTSGCGIALADWTRLAAFAGNGLLISMAGAFPIVFGTNNVERARFDSAGLLTLITPGKCILVKPSSAPAANTIMMELQSNAAASLWSVDAEGDQINRTLKLVGAVADTLLIQPASASGGAKLFVIKDTGGTEGVSMRDTGQVNLTGAGASVLADCSTSAAVVFEVKLSGVQKAAIDSDGWMAGTALTVGSGTKITKVVAYSPTLSPSSVSANSTAEQTFTVSGLTTSDRVTIPNKPSHQSGLGIVGARVSAADTLAITFINITAGSITPTASETYKFLAFRS